MRALAAIVLAIWLALLAVPGTMAQLQHRDYFRVSSGARKYAVIFAGTGADETYQEQFKQWAAQLYGIFENEYGYRPDEITLLAGRGNAAEDRFAGPCRQATIAATLKKLQKRVRAGDQIAFIFIGHGTSDDQDAKFVIAGPDISGRDFAENLQAFPDQDIIVVNTTASGYPFCSALSAAGRVIVCATRSAAERYDTVFAQYFLEALKDHAADRDKNRRVSILEAFWYAREKVKKWYTDQDRLPSEHPTIDDNGDGNFSIDPDPAKDDGRLAEIAYLDSISTAFTEETADGPLTDTLRRLTAKAQELERSVILLRHQKNEMTEKDYWRQIETLLIDLARTTRQLRSLQADFQTGF